MVFLKSNFYLKVIRVEDDSRIARVDVSVIGKIDQIADLEDGDQLSECFNFVFIDGTVFDW